MPIDSVRSAAVGVPGTGQKADLNNRAEISSEMLLNGDSLRTHLQFFPVLIWAGAAGHGLVGGGRKELLGGLESWTQMPLTDDYPAQWASISHGQTRTFPLVFLPSTLLLLYLHAAHSHITLKLVHHNRIPRVPVQTLLLTSFCLVCHIAWPVSIRALLGVLPLCLRIVVIVLDTWTFASRADACPRQTFKNGDADRGNPP